MLGTGKFRTCTVAVPCQKIGEEGQRERRRRYGAALLFAGEQEEKQRSEIALTLALEITLLPRKCREANNSESS
jgi:hypothetical protein